MKKIAKISVFLILVLIPLFSFAQNVDVTAKPSYIFHLYYDRNQLFADRDFEFAYDIIPEVYTPVPPTSSNLWRIDVIDFLGRVAHSYPFDPQNGDPAFLEGKIKVKAPYITDGDNAIFYDAFGAMKLTLRVSESSICNDNTVCQSDLGENSNTCPYDCTAPTTPTPSTPAQEGGGSGLGYIIFGLLLIGLFLAGAWYFWRRQSGGQKSYPERPIY